MAHPWPSDNVLEAVAQVELGIHLIVENKHADLGMQHDEPKVEGLTCEPA